jgi:hypothetical protein
MDHTNTHTLKCITDYLRFRQISLDPAPLAAYLEQQGIVASLFAIEDDCAALLDRFDAAVYDDFLPTRTGRREAEALISAARQELLAHIEHGRVDGEHAELDDEGNGCLLAILADALDRHWSFLRLSEDDPLLIERFVYGVHPGHAHQTHPALAVFHTWILRALPTERARGVPHADH